MFPACVENVRERCLCETLRQYTNPKQGWDHFDDEKVPKSINEWLQAFQNNHGWSNWRIPAKIAKVFLTLPFGEVIPNGDRYYGFYQKRYSFSLIRKKLGMEKKPIYKTHRMVLNYHSFRKLAATISHTLTGEEKKAFIKDFSLWLKTVCPSTFFLYEAIDFRTVHFLRKYLAEKGEIIISDYSCLERIRSGDHGLDINNKKHSDEKKTFSKKEILQKFPARLVLNETSIRKMILASLKIAKKYKQMYTPQKNYFHLLGGYEDDLVSEFAKLSF